MRPIQEIQKALVNSIYETDSGYYQFRMVQSIIDPIHFGMYWKLIELAMEDKFQDKINRSTEIIKRGLGSQYIEAIDWQFHLIDFFDDLAFLLKTVYLSSQNYEDIVELQEKLDYIKDKKAFDNSKNYIIRELYDGCITELSEFMERKKSWKTLWYSYWFPILDRYTEWIQRGTVTRLNAYTNVGKSKFSYHVVNSLLDQWAHVLYYSLEVTKNRVVYNLISNRYKMDMNDVYRMEFDDIDFWELFTKKLEIIDNKRELQDIIQYTESRKPDAIIIDFVQNIQCKGSEYERMTEVAVKLQELAISNNIAIFDLSQISNAGSNYSYGDTIPSKGSWALVASWDVWLILSRGDKEGTLNVTIAKNKYWYAGKTLEYESNMSKWTFREIWEAKPKNQPF